MKAPAKKPAAKLHIESSYLSCIYDPKLFKKTVIKTIAAIKRIMAARGVDAIAFRGSSGAALAFIVGHKLGLSLLHVRKDSSHSGLVVEGNVAAERVVIIDDFVASGDTINKIVGSLERNMRPESTMRIVGLVLYNASGTNDDLRRKCRTLPSTAIIEKFQVNR